MNGGRSGRRIWTGAIFARRCFGRPLDGGRFRKANYQWKGGAFGEVANATAVTLRRAWAVRRLREQGAARQRELLAWDRRLARVLAGKLKAEHTHLLVSQNLLPFLWRDGVLGGRTFDVFMVRLPLAELQRELDRAAALHPESGTCADFRAPVDLLEAETKALAAASRWITPHAAIAELGGGRALRLPWKIKASEEECGRGMGNRIVFPASTLCRKGAYELREAARALDLEVVCLGGFLEGADFWSGVRMGSSRHRGVGWREFGPGRCCRSVCRASAAAVATSGGGGRAGDCVRRLVDCGGCPE